jgi:hypothetical protein
MKQLALPLKIEPGADSALRRAWIASRVRLPFHIAISTPAIAICLRRMAAAETRRNCRPR